MALKVKELQAAKPGEWLSDGGARGAGTLLFRRTAAGAMVAYFRYTLPDGRRDALPIGQYDEAGRDGLTLAESRAKAGELSRLYQSGVRNVRAHLDAARAADEAAKQAEQDAQAAAAKAEADRQKYTLRALCDAYVAHLEAQGKSKSAGATRSAFKVHVFGAYPDKADKPAREITSHDVAAIIRKVHEAGKERMAGILRSYLSAAFNAASKAPFDPQLPSSLIAFGVEHNPVERTATIPVRAGQRVLSADELRAYVKSLGPELADTALRLALLAGGQRMAQLLRAKVGDFDQGTATLRLWDGKGRRATEREHLLPLGPKGAALVAELVGRVRARDAERAKAAGEEAGDIAGEWLFSTHGRVQMAETTPGHRLHVICAAMGGAPFNLRDIRRTCETMLAGMGVSRETRAQLLSHGISGVQAAHYDRHAYTDEKRAALIAWERRLDQIEKGKTGAEVLPMRKRRAAA